MRNDSIESLMQRHYGNTAGIPVGLKQQLHASVQNTAVELQRQHLAATRMRERRMSRRQALRFVASNTGSAGMGLLNIGLEGLQALENSLVGQEAVQKVYP